MSVSISVKKRLSTGLRKFRKVVEDSKKRDLNESDTSTVITDILSDLFGFDKYLEITSEHSIKNTYCDIAIKIEGDVKLLIEVKAIGVVLKDAHAKQAVDYAANEGVDWVILTNGEHWKVFHISFSKPISQELFAEFNFMKVNLKSKRDLELLYSLTKEGFLESAMQKVWERHQCINKFNIAAIIMSSPVIGVIRRELRRLNPKAQNVSTEEIQGILRQQVICETVVNVENTKLAQKLAAKTANRPLRKRRKSKDSNTEISSPQPPFIDELRLALQLIKPGLFRANGEDVASASRKLAQIINKSFLYQSRQSDYGETEFDILATKNVFKGDRDYTIGSISLIKSNKDQLLCLSVSFGSATLLGGEEFGALQYSDSKDFKLSELEKDPKGLAAFLEQKMTDIYLDRLKWLEKQYAGKSSS